MSKEQKAKHIKEEEDEKTMLKNKEIGKNMIV